MASFMPPPIRWEDNDHAIEHMLLTVLKDNGYLRLDTWEGESDRNSTELKISITRQIARKLFKDLYPYSNHVGDSKPLSEQRLGKLTGIHINTMTTAYAEAKGILGVTGAESRTEEQLSASPLHRYTWPEAKKRCPLFLRLRDLLGEGTTITDHSTSNSGRNPGNIDTTLRGGKYDDDNDVLNDLTTVGGANLEPDQDATAEMGAEMQAARPSATPDGETEIPDVQSLDEAHTTALTNAAAKRKEAPETSGESKEVLQGPAKKDLEPPPSTPQKRQGSEVLGQLDRILELEEDGPQKRIFEHEVTVRHRVTEKYAFKRLKIELAHKAEESHRDRQHHLYVLQLNLSAQQPPAPSAPAIKISPAANVQWHPAPGAIAASMQSARNVQASPDTQISNEAHEDQYDGFAIV
ncbi:MAG: hypothetical protein Q9210_003300 [Variospora velana]